VSGHDFLGRLAGDGGNRFLVRKGNGAIGEAEQFEDKAAFEEMLRTMDMPASVVKNPTCTSKLARRELRHHGQTSR
jgi:hypothetical protein